MPRPETPAAEAVDVAVVGAGAAGLSTAGALTHRGVKPLVLERDDRVGAVWSDRYERLALHTTRRFSGLAHYPIPRDYPRYVPKDLYARYLDEYARRFALDVRLGRRVERVRPDGGRWRLEAGDAVWRARAVVVATGYHGRPSVPAWPGAEGFRGRVLHSSEYRTGRDFAGERVLVVGIGNSGAEIATDLREQGATHVALAVRSAPPISRRELAGIPVQLFGIALFPLPARAVDRVGAALRRIGTGDLRPYGLAPAAWGPFGARRPPVIDVGFLAELKAGRVEVRPDVQRLTEGGAVFTDGREEPFDALVAATGFESGLGELVDAPAAIGERGRPAATDGRPSGYPGLYFVGFRETVRGALFEANRDSRRVARAVARYLEEDA